MLQKRIFAEMKIRKQPLRILKAYTLLSMYVLFLLSWSLHHFIDQDHHDEVKTCYHTKGEKHFHGDEYAADDCSLCQIAPNLAEFLELQMTGLLLSELIPCLNNSGETTYLPVSPFSLAQPRAPPVVLS